MRPDLQPKNKSVTVSEEHYNISLNRRILRCRTTHSEQNNFLSLHCKQETFISDLRQVQAHKFVWSYLLAWW